MWDMTLAGAIMPDISGFRKRIGDRIGSFSSVLFLPLFFVFTRLRTQIGLREDIEGWSICLLITAVATLGKLGGSAAAARFEGMSWAESLQFGALMNSRGLMGTHRTEHRIRSWHSFAAHIRYAGDHGDTHNHDDRAPVESVSKTEN